MINEAVKKLVTYGLETGLIENEDVIYTTNAILETLGISEYEEPASEWQNVELEPVLKELLDYACDAGMIENNIVSRHLRTRDSLEKQFSDFGELTADEQLIFHYMYNSGNKMTTAKAIELTGRSQSFVVKLLHNLRDLEIITWFGSSKNDRNQYYLLVDK